MSFSVIRYGSNTPAKRRSPHPDQRRRDAYASQSTGVTGVWRLLHHLPPRFEVHELFDLAEALQLSPAAVARDLKWLLGKELIQMVPGGLLQTASCRYLAEKFSEV